MTTINELIRVSLEVTGFIPDCLEGKPLLLPAIGTQLRSGMDQWMDKYSLHPLVITEFEDRALMKAFARRDSGSLSQFSD